MHLNQMAFEEVVQEIIYMYQVSFFPGDCKIESLPRFLPFLQTAYKISPKCENPAKGNREMNTALVCARDRVAQG